MKPLFLTLEVTSPHASLLGPSAVHTFDFRGGRFGRHADNEWHIPDPNRDLSRHQGRITFANGLFYIENRSQNVPICINGEEFSVTPEQPYPLHDGDKLLVGDYVFEVRLTDEPPSQAVTPEIAQANVAVDGLDDIHCALFGDAPIPSTPPPAPNHDGGSDHRKPRPKAKNPLDLFPSSTLDTKPPPASIPHASPLDEPAPVSRAEPRQRSTGDAIDAVLGIYEDREEPALHASSTSNSRDASQGIGTDPARVSPDVARLPAEVLPIVVGGLRQLLASRAAIKGQFRLPGTVVQVKENNPLKMASTVEETLDLLRTPSGSYMSPQQAFEEAFDDIRHHEMAMLAGIQAGYEHLLERFDPQRIKNRADKQATGPRLPLGAGARYWDFYSAYFTRETEDKADAFRHLFGDAFARAYEEKLQELKSHARAQRKAR